MDKRQPLLEEKTPHAAGKDRRKVGEVAGGTAAECAAIWFCCPCAMMDLLVLAVYKVPTGLCKKAWKKKMRKRMKKKKAMLQQQQQESTSASSSDGIRSSSDESEILRSDVDEAIRDGSTVDFEAEMLNRFYGAGFWRSSSKRD